jgi:outer membrane protein
MVRSVLLSRILLTITLLTVEASVSCAAEVVRLSLKEAIRLALLPAGQARLQLAAEAEKLAESHVRQARSATLLHVDAEISDRVLRFDLRSIGVDIPQVSPFVANIEFPTVVGPFTVLGTEVQASKSIINRPAAYQVQAARESVESSKTQTKAVANQITAETARAYFDALRAKSETDLASENVKLSQGRLSLAVERRANGLVTGSEVRHANLDVAEAGQKLYAAQTAYRNAALQLVALIGLPLDTEVELTDEPVYHAESSNLAEAIQTALRSRTEMETGDLDAQSLRLQEQSIAAEALPTLGVFADAGAVTVAPTPSGDANVISTPTYTAGFEFRLPILDGHRRAGQRQEIEAQIREAKIRQAATKRQIELQVRVAFESLQSTARQVQLAEQIAVLAEGDSEETRARYQEGEASGLELADAQARAYRSKHDYLTAVYQHELSRVALAEATGAIAATNW